MMNELITRGIICLKDDYNFKYKIADIDYIEYENGEFKYLFYPHYSVIDLLNSYLFEGIPGLNLDKRKVCYERKNMTPVFISERSPSENRADLWELLDMYNMKSLNRLEWLIRTDMTYFGDRLYVEKRNEIDDNRCIKMDSMFDLIKRSDNLVKELLKIICYDNCLDCKEININNNNRKDYYNLLMPMYIKEYNLKRNKINEGIAKAKANNNYKGRKKIEINPLKFNEISNKYLKKLITLDETLKILKISKSTFFRRLKDLNDEI